MKEYLYKTSTGSLIKTQIGAEVYEGDLVEVKFPFSDESMYMEISRVIERIIDPNDLSVIGKFEDFLNSE